MRTITVVLGEKEYVLRELPVRKNREWRERLQKPFGELVEALQGARDTEIDNLRAVGGLVQQLSALLLGSVDIVIDLIFAYAPELAEDGKYIEENGYDSQFLEAFASVLGLAYPFSMWMGPVRRAARELNAIGSRDKETSTSSAAANGASGTTRSIPLSSDS